MELSGAVGSYDQDTIQIYLAIQDITEYKRSQETIACLNEKLVQKIHEQTAALDESSLNLTRRVDELKYSRQQTVCWRRHFLFNLAGKQQTGLKNKGPNTLVYLVDDEFAVRDSLALLIESTGQAIRTFISIGGFLNNYDPELPGCLIMDVRMTSMNGLELQDELMKRGISIPIIFISGHAGVPDSAKAIRAGTVSFLVKPFDSQVLLERIEEAINKDIASREQSSEYLLIQGRLENLTEREHEVLL